MHTADTLFIGCGYTKVISRVFICVFYRWKVPDWKMFALYKEVLSTVVSQPVDFDIS
jgi:hypothetical protein